DLNSVTPGAAIRYTLDGSIPCENSPLYTEPLHIEGSCTVNARCWKDGRASRTLSLKPVKAEYIQAAKLSEEYLADGLAYSYYTGEFSLCSQIASGRLCSRGSMAYPSIKDAADQDHFAYIFEGFVRIPHKGVWEFAIISDDGSMMYLDGQVVVDNDGSHAADLATGRIALDEGWHQLRILYFEDYEGEDFDFLWKQDGEFVHIPENNLKH
ncbi:MAG: chitobiase/beta-hexosaminidase C-terminal domain-containing protein, partial [Bacteroidales bacterium]|nr:chitobiase/beta-hexosaminidase C-terminal domain-containing protein [Candidatus Cryptobacteroides equifaecalis]